MEMQAFGDNEHELFAGAEGWGDHPPLYTEGVFADGLWAFVVAKCGLTLYDLTSGPDEYFWPMEIATQAEAVELARCFEFDGRDKAAVLKLFSQKK